MNSSAQNKLKVTKKGLLILALIGIIFIIVLIIQVFSFNYGGIDFFIRLFSLWGYISMSIAAIMTPFLKEIYVIFGKPFIKIHHVFAFSGIVLITLHPIFFAIFSRTASVLVPVFSSWYDFFLYAGRPALIILYIALIGVLLRKKFKIWRIIHALMYLIIFLGFIHAVLLGTDFANISVLIIYSLLLAATLASFVAKRVQIYKSFKKKKSM